MPDPDPPRRADLADNVDKALRGQSLDDLNSQQLERATSPQPALEGKELREWIMTGNQPNTVPPNPDMGYPNDPDREGSALRESTS